MTLEPAPPSDLQWGPWFTLADSYVAAAVPAEPGIYRVRAQHDAVLAYVGQTGRSLRGRLSQLRTAYGQLMPYRDPHTAAPALWAWLHSESAQLEASVAPVAGCAPARKGFEALAIAAHRQQHRRAGLGQTAVPGRGPSRHQAEAPQRRHVHPSRPRL
jgi:hypothetical protein